MKTFVAILIGFGAGLVFAGCAAIVSPLREPVHNTGILGLGIGLLTGSVGAWIALRQRKQPPDQKDGRGHDGGA